MITGFNTDIVHNGITYHVQTEDKGLDTPLILSLVYNRGTILASKRSPYNDLVQKGFDKAELAERLQKQHKTICAAVRAGRIEDLKRMTARESLAKKEVTSPAPALAKHNLEPISIPKPNTPPPNVAATNNFTNSTPFPPSKPSVQTVVQEKPSRPIPQPNEELVWELPLKILDEELVVEPDSIVEEEDKNEKAVLIEDAIEIVTDTREYKQAELGQLEIEFISSTSFKAGERKTLQIRVFRGHADNAMADSQVMVKVLGSSFRPLIFHARTDAQGVAVVHLQLPQFQSGRAALLVRAMNGGEEAELRQIIRPH